jgi:tRNA (cytidine/uridine-2'-O-)-methyltransferase
MKIILYQPEIPQNTGNIVRTCAVTGTELILVHPLGFSLASRHLKRAGLDYWKDTSIQEIDDLMLFLEQTSSPFFFFSSKASSHYTDVKYTSDALLIFGSETKGLAEPFWRKWPDHFVRIPMLPQARCLNLACSVSIAVYEALRQTGFKAGTSIFS